MANSDSTFSDDLSLERISLSLKNRETIAKAFKWSVPSLISGANIVNIRSTGCLSADSKSIGFSKLRKNPCILSNFLIFICGIATPLPIPVGPRNSAAAETWRCSWLVHLHAPRPY